MPALAAFVLDSDCAAVEGLTPAGIRWEGCLHPEVAEAYGAPEMPWEIESVLAWSAEAGLAADPGEVGTAIEARTTFAEDTLDGLLVALGVPATD